MTDPSSNHRLAGFTLTLYWGCISLGIGIPWLATIIVDLLKHGQSTGQALHQLRLHLFAPGYNLFLVGILNAIPFVLFAVFALFHLGGTSPQNRRMAMRRATGVTVTSLGLIGLALWTHVTTLWYPDAQGALVYFFLPIVLVALIPVGYSAGRGLGILLFR